MLIVGLTGGIASGKSTVSIRLGETHKLTVIDADRIAREVVTPGKKAYNGIVAAFDSCVPELVNPVDKSLNRAALGHAVFGNPERLKVLNSLVHPAVRKEIIKQVFAAYFRFESLVILDVPLLFESGLDRISGLTVTVSCDYDVQIQRLLKRNPELPRDDAEKRIASQMGNDEKNYRADVVIDNNKDFSQLSDSVDSVVRAISPSRFVTVLDFFPPFGFISAFFTFAVRLVRDRYRGTAPPPRKDD